MSGPASPPSGEMRVAQVTTDGVVTFALSSAGRISLAA
jgi:hypothetical protein